VSDEQIATTLRTVSDPEDAAKQLVNQARDHGGSDNITCVVVDVIDDDNRAEHASAILSAEPPPPPQSRGQAATLQPSDDGGAGARATMAPPRTEPPAVPTARPRRLTWRVFAFILAVVIVVALAFVAVGWYARHTYYVGLDNGQVAIFKGRPGGLLWFQPTLDQRTSLAEKDVPPSRLPDVKSGQEEATRAEAQRYVNALRQEAATQAATTTTTALAPAPAPAQPAPATSTP
jgi:protein phosphatase